jgi:hypothetical protein
MPRSPYAYSIERGTGSVRKVARWLRAVGIDERFVTPTMRARHVHPRHKRAEATQTLRDAELHWSYPPTTTDEEPDAPTS